MSTGWVVAFAVVGTLFLGDQLWRVTQQQRLLKRITRAYDRLEVDAEAVMAEVQPLYERSHQLHRADRVATRIGIVALVGIFILGVVFS